MDGLLGRRFRVVWAGESLSGLGDAAFLVAFGWLVLSVTGSPAVLAATLVAAAVPRGVLLLAGGAVVDRLSARTVLLDAHLVRGVGGLAATAAAGDPGLPVPLTPRSRSAPRMPSPGRPARPCSRRWSSRGSSPARTPWSPRPSRSRCRSGRSAPARWWRWPGRRWTR